MIQTILSITAILFSLLFSIYLGMRRKEWSVAGIALSLAFFISALLELFDLCAIRLSADLNEWKTLALFAEGCLAPAWFWYSMTFAREQALKQISLPQRLILFGTLLFPVVPLILPFRSFLYSPDFGVEQVLFLGNAGYVFYIALLVVFVISLINLEATLANAVHGARWKIKLEVVGVGLYLSTLVFYFSQGLLYRTINMQLLPVRTSLLLVTVFLVAYSRIRRGNGVRVAVSKQFAYKSLVLFVVGMYLVGLGLMGEGLKYFGESFPKSMAIALALVVSAGLLLVLLSEKVKRKISVFINKNFYQHKYDYRVQWFQFTTKLSSSKSGEELLSSILTGFVDTFGMACGALFLRSHVIDRFEIRTLHEMDPTEISFKPGEEFIRTMTERGWVVNFREIDRLSDAHSQRFLDECRAAFAVPLLVNGNLDGFVLLGKPIDQSETYNFEDYDLMKAIAFHAASAMLNLRLSERLAEEREMAAIGRVSAFVIHDLKNLVYTLSLILDNARDYIGDPEFQEDMLESLGNTVAKMKVLIAKLKNVPEKTELLRESTDLFKLARDTIALVPGGNINVAGDTVVASVDKEEIEKVALNLLLNAIDASDPAGPVIIEVGKESDAFIRVRDAGCGMGEDFIRNHLFAPFKTTKNKGLGIGLYQCRQIVEAHGGRIEVESAVGAGTTFTVWLPL